MAKPSSSEQKESSPPRKYDNAILNVGLNCSTDAFVGLNNTS